MHEASIAVAICEEVAERAERDDIAVVKTVRIRVGELSSVVNEALLFAWDVATEGTVAEGAVLEIERVPVAVYCPACDCERAPLHPNHLLCSFCGASTPSISKGLELELVAMEVYDAVETH